MNVVAATKNEVTKPYRYEETEKRRRQAKQKMKELSLLFEQQKETRF